MFLSCGHSYPASLKLFPIPCEARAVFALTQVERLASLGTVHKLQVVSLAMCSVTASDPLMGKSAHWYAGELGQVRCWGPGGVVPVSGRVVPGRT